MTLVGYWPLNEESGSKAYDHSGNENHGTLTGEVTRRVTGLLGDTSYSFDGDNDYVGIGEPSGFGNSSLGNSVSVSGWFYPRADQGDIFSHASDSNNDNLRVFWNSSRNTWGSYIHANNSNTMDWNTSPELNSWNHVVLIYDGENQYQYLNNELVAQKSNTGDLASSKGSPWTVGSRGGDSSFFDGKISEVRLYDRPLTESEIQYLYSVGSRGLQTTVKKSS
ncbi:LamG domain-containing protein [Candidatus Nanosalina sp. VS9-1]|uniref:LamG domain-containing protein n=1 Tax=Candidatus Nanosalina sp. VS9-1 TaxID=3388566 RepID=UPI0039DFA7D5